MDRANGEWEAMYTALKEVVANLEAEIKRLRDLDTSEAQTREAYQDGYDDGYYEARVEYDESGY